MPYYQDSLTGQAYFVQDASGGDTDQLSLLVEQIEQANPSLMGNYGFGWTNYNPGVLSPTAQSGFQPISSGSVIVGGILNGANVQINNSSVTISQRDSLTGQSYVSNNSSGAEQLSLSAESLEQANPISRENNEFGLMNYYPSFLPSSVVAQPSFQPISGGNIIFGGILNGANVQVNGSPFIISQVPSGFITTGAFGNQIPQIDFLQSGSLGALSLEAYSGA